MKYTFKDILDAETYENTRVLFILGRYTWFNNMICDTLKDMCRDDKLELAEYVDLSSEFGLDSNIEAIETNSVDFNTFMNVIGVSNINGKWFCRTDYSTLTKKQKEQLFKYIKEPSENGILIIVSNDFMQYKEILRNKIFGISKYSNIIQLGFPNRNILKNIVTQVFNEHNIEITKSAVDFFIMRMSTAYDDYEEQILNIVDIHKNGVLTEKELKVYMKGIENFIIDDYIYELIKPPVNGKITKKLLRIMVALEDEYTPKTLVLKLLSKIDEYIEYRILINKGYIPIGINFFYNDVIKSLPNKEKYEKVSEWQFRRKADIASRTSLKDWEYMKLILSKAVENNKISDTEMNYKCERALYDLSNRSVLSSITLNNSIGLGRRFDDICIEKINNIQYNEDSLHQINESKALAE